jgi:hypothetical protein
MGLMVKLWEKLAPTLSPCPNENPAILAMPFYF